MTDDHPRHDRPQPPLSDDEIAAFRQLVREREFSAKLWQLLRVYAPWVLGLGGSVVTGLYWIYSHFNITIK